MHRVLAVLLACLSASNSIADQIQFFPPLPTTADQVEFSIEAELPDDADFSWSVQRPGEKEFTAIANPLGTHQETLGTPGRWIFEVVVTYAKPPASGDGDAKKFSRTLRTAVIVAAPASLKARTVTETAEMSSGEEAAREADEAANAAKQEAARLDKLAKQALANAQATERPEDYDKATVAAKKYADALDILKKLQKEKSETANDTFGLRERVISLLANPQYTNPRNADPEFFRNAGAVVKAFDDATDKATAKLPTQGADKTARDKALALVTTELTAVFKPKVANGEMLFPEESNELRDRVWRDFLTSLYNEVYNLNNRSEHWERLEDPANQIRLYEEIGAAIEEVLDREKEFTKNYKTLQNFRDKYGEDEHKAERRRSCWSFMLGL